MALAWYVFQFVHLFPQMNMLFSHYQNIKCSGMTFHLLNVLLNDPLSESPVLPCAPSKTLSFVEVISVYFWAAHAKKSSDTQTGEELFIRHTRLLINFNQGSSVMLSHAVSPPRQRSCKSSHSNCLSFINQGQEENIQRLGGQGQTSMGILWSVSVSKHTAEFRCLRAFRVTISEVLTFTV